MYIGFSGGVLQVPTGGHAPNFDHWFPVEKLGEQTGPHLQRKMVSVTHTKH